MLDLVVVGSKGAWESCGGGNNSERGIGRYKDIEIERDRERDIEKEIDREII